MAIDYNSLRASALSADKRKKGTTSNISSINYDALKKQAAAKDQLTVLENGLSNTNRLKQLVGSKYQSGAYLPEEDDYKDYSKAVSALRKSLTRSASLLEEKSRSELNSFLGQEENKLSQMEKMFSKFKNADEYNAAFKNSEYSEKYKSATTYNDVNNIINGADYSKLDDEEKKWLNSYRWQVATSDELQKEYDALDRLNLDNQISPKNIRLLEIHSALANETGDREALIKEQEVLEKEVAALTEKQGLMKVLKTAMAERRAEEEFNSKWGKDIEKMKKSGYSSNLDVSKALPSSKNATEEAAVRSHATSNDNPLNLLLNNMAYDKSKGEIDYSTYAPLLTEDEKLFINWLAENKGKEKANEYFKDLISVSLDKKKNNELMQQAFDFTSQNGWTGAVGSVGSVVTSLGSGLEYVANLATGQGDRRSTLSSVTTGLREGTKENWNGAKAEKVWDFLYDTGMSGVDSVAAVGVSAATGLPFAGEFLLGSSAAANTANDLLDRGVTGGDVVLASLAAGAAESIFEHLSIGKILDTGDITKGFTKAGIKQAVKKVSTDMLVNFTEESLTEVSNIITDQLFSGELSSYAVAVKNYYTQDGLSIEEAKAKAAKDMGVQIGMAGLSGMLMGFGFGVGGSIVGLSSSQIKNSKSGNAVLSKNNLGVLKTMAKASGISEIIEAAEKLTESSKPSEVGFVFNRLYEKSVEKSIEAMAPELMKNGATKGGTNAASSWAMQIIKSATASQKTKSDLMNDLVLRTNKVTKDVYSAFVDEGKFGGDVIFALNEIRTSPVNQATAQTNSESAIAMPENAAGQENKDSAPKTTAEIYGQMVKDHLEKVSPTPKNPKRKKTWLQKVLGDAIISSEARSDENEGTNADVLEGRKVSASRRGKNRVRPHGANTEIIRRFLGHINGHEGDRTETITAGDSAWLSRPDFEPAKKVGGGLRESFLRNIQRVVSNGFDSIGRRLSPELQEKVSDTVFMEEDGTIFSFFHWSPNKFDEFKYGDGAFHCGTLMSAFAIKERSDKKVDGYLKEMYVISKKPFVIEDAGRFGAYSVAKLLVKYGIIDQKDLLRISEMDGFFSDRYDAEANVYVRGVLESLGYDSYLYQNLNEDGGAWSVGVFNANQIITIAENGVLKENCGVTEADSVDGSVSSFADSEDINADADVNADNYAKEDKYWEAENENEKNVSKGLFDKIKNLFSNKNADSITSIGEIVNQIEKDFGVPVSTGRFKQKAYGIYKNKTEAIRTKVSNALPTIAHEIGHHLDKRYGLRKLPSIDEAIQVLKDTRPNFYASYKQSVIPAEAVAEFVRDYLADRTLAKNKYTKFFAEFEGAFLSADKQGRKDLGNLKAIGDMINRYFVAEKQERARAAVISRAEAKRRNRRNKTFDDWLTKFQTNFVDEGTVLKKISDKAHDLYDYSLKTFVRVQSNLTGDYFLGFDGEKVKNLDRNGKTVKDKNGNDVYISALTRLFDDIRTQTEMDAFEQYLIYKHGLEFLANGKRVFADDSINNKDYLTEEIKRLEAENPNFKEIAESVYEWQRTLMYEYGVKSGLMKKETAEALWAKYPCYVPFNRNVEEAKGGKGKVGFVNQSSPVRNAKGSGLDLLGIYENIALKTQEFMLAADRNAVMQEIANTVDQTDGFGYLLEKVPPQQAPINVSAEGTKRTIAQILNDNLNKANATALYDELDNAIGDLITGFKISYNQGVDVVSVCRNGERTYYQVHDKNLLKALLGLSKTQLSAVEQSIGRVTRLFKALTTGGNAIWSITSNAPRDFSSAYKYSVEKNPIKYTLDYFKAIMNVLSQMGKEEKHANEYLKLYKALGGGYNSSLANVRQLQYTVKEIINLDKTMPQKVAHMFNVLHHIEALSDAIETAPRLAEFKRVLELTGDKQKALLAAENITVNFNRRGTVGKNFDQFLPYFNASIQGTTKFLDNLLHNPVFRTKTIVSGILKTALLFAWNMLFMGDDDNEEYEKLSAYKKNNFYNIYKGDGKFISIPKAKDTAYFDSLVERIFETAFKQDVDWGQEVRDFAAYTWLVFGPPFFINSSGKTDIVLASTAADLISNTDFKGSPIVSSVYEELLPKYQYDENTTWIAYGLGQMSGLSPMKIDHVIDSNLGWLGLINRSLGKLSGEADWGLGVGIKTVADNTYSTDILNHFYDNAERASKTAKSLPNDGEAAAMAKQYAAAKSVISSLNAYGKEDENATRDYRIMARDYADNFEKNTVGNFDKRLIALYERTGNSDVFADKTFNREYSIDKVKYVMDSDIYLEYVDEYYSKVDELYEEILSMGVSDEMTALMLTQAKQEVGDLLNDKYKTEDGTLNTKVSSDWRGEVVDSMKGNINRKAKSGDISASEQRKYNRYLNYLD